MKIARWTALALAAIGAYAVASAALVPSLIDFNDTRHHVDFTVGIALPLHVVWQALGGWRLTLCVWALAVGLAVAGRQCAEAIARTKPRPWVLVGVQCLLLTALLAVTVTFSGDVYAYVIYGRLYGLHGLSPYLLGSAVPQYGDAALAQCLRFYGNPPPGDNYGPLWTLFAGGIARLEAPLSLAAQVWTHRVLAALASVATTAGVVYAMRAIPAAERVRRAGAFALHPLVLYETAVGGHNDMLMVAPAVWAFAIADELPLVAGLLLGASIAVKYVSVILLPFLALRLARKSASAAWLAAIIALALPVLFFQPFWDGWQTIYSLIGHGGVFAMSPQWLANIPFFASGLADRQPVWPRAIQFMALGVFIGIAGVSLVRYAGSRSLANLWRTVTAFVLSLPIIHPWYVLWLVPGTAHRGRWSTFAWWLGLFAFARYALDGVAPVEAGAWYTPMLVVLTVIMIAVPAALCLRDSPRAAAAAPGER